jgi:sphinganine-1-phosphate aldolase
MAFVDAYRQGIADIPGLRVLGEPDLSIVAFGADDVDIFRVAEVMEKRGWLPGLLQKPKGIHRMMSMIQAPSLDEYLADLKAALRAVREEGSGAGSRLKATY